MADEARPESSQQSEGAAANEDAEVEVEAHAIEIEDNSDLQQAKYNLNVGC